MGVIEINWRPDAEELRRFGGSLLVGFALIGSLAYLYGVHSTGWRDWSVGTLPLALWTTGAVAGSLGLSGAKIALPVYWAWMGIAFVMGNIVSHLILALFYYGMITPMGFCMRLAGRDKLSLRRRRAASYWRDVPASPDKSRYERQF